MIRSINIMRTTSLGHGFDWTRSRSWTPGHIADKYRKLYDSYLSYRILFLVNKQVCGQKRQIIQSTWPQLASSSLTFILSLSRGFSLISKPFLYIFVILWFVSLNEITESDFCILNLRLYLVRHHFESQISSSELKPIFQLTKWRFKFSYRITEKSLTTAIVVTNKRWNSIPFFRPSPIQGTLHFRLTLTIQQMETFKNVRLNWKNMNSIER